MWLTAKYRIHFNFQNPQKIAYSAAKVELPNKQQKVDYIYHKESLIYNKQIAYLAAI